MAQFDYLVDVENRRLVSSFLSTRAASAPSFVIGDQPTMAVRLVRGNSNNPNQPWAYIEPSATQSIRVAVGDLGGAPAAGSFVMSFDGDDTAALPYDATGDEVGLALNTLASIVSAGGVTVTDLNGGGYRIAFIDNGARSLVSLDTDSLSPTTGAFVSESITGSATTSSIQLVAIETMPAAFSELTTELPAPNVDINTIRSGVLDTTAELKQVTITGEPYNGTYSLLIGGIESSFISWDATPEAIQAAVEAIDVTWAGLISVLGTSESYTIEFDKSLGDIGSGTANNDTLTGAKGRSGSLDLNVTGLVELLQGNPSTTATFEIQLFDATGSVPETVLQTRCAVNQDLIPANPTSSTPIPDYALAIHTHTIPQVDGLQTELDDLQDQITVNTIENITRYQGRVSLASPTLSQSEISDANLRVAESVGERLTIVMDEDFSSLVVEKTIMTIKNVDGVESYYSLLLETVGVITSDDEILTGSLIGDHYLIAYNGGLEYTLTGSLTAFDRMIFTPSFFTQAGSTLSGGFDNLFAEVQATWTIGNQARMIKFDCFTGVRDLSGVHRSLNVISSTPNSNIAIAGVLYDSRNLPVINHVFGCIDEGGQISRPSLNFTIYNSLNAGATSPIVNIT